MYAIGWYAIVKLPGLFKKTGSNKIPYNKPPGTFCKKYYVHFKNALAGNGRGLVNCPRSLGGNPAPEKKGKVYRW